MLRRLAIQKAGKLREGKWIFVYDRRSYEMANNVFENLQKASVTLGMVIEQPQWFELNSLQEMDIFEEQLTQFIKKSGQPQIAMLMLTNEH